jgi:RNA polymerase sigma factor (sigma-70 family)
VEPDFDSLFRRESGRLTSALLRRFGPDKLPLVEDVVHDALVRAMEVWRYSGVPENASSWLLVAAKNKLLDALRRQRTAANLEPELERAVEAFVALPPEEESKDELVRDDQLRMMFACCHGRVPEETQVALILNLLSGFGAKEVAAAFFVSEAAMEKRLSRGKELLRESKRLLEVTPDRVEEHLGAVHGALYLVFNEGYHGNHEEESIKVELCAEALRLTALLAEDPLTARPATHALFALMCLTAARLPGRTDAKGDLLTLEAQDRSLWDARLVRQGILALEESASGDVLTPYHVEAAIAYEHTTAPSHAATRWDRIVGHYDQLMKLRPSPVVALSRAIAVGELEGPDRALEELLRVEGKERLGEYPFYAAAVGSQHLRAGRVDAARESFREALAVARNPVEVRFLERRLASCDSSIEPASRG